MIEDILFIFLIVLMDLYLFVFIYLLRYLDLNDIIGLNMKKCFVSRETWLCFNKVFSKSYCFCFYIKYVVFLIVLCIHFKFHIEMDYVEAVWVLIPIGFFYPFIRIYFHARKINLALK